jgi:hypothetical protein
LGCRAKKKGAAGWFSLQKLSRCMASKTQKSHVYWTNKSLPNKIKI